MTLTCHCDACGEFVPRETRATVQVRMGKAGEFKFDLCSACQFFSVAFFEKLVGYQVLDISREVWSDNERNEYRQKIKAAS